MVIMSFNRKYSLQIYDLKLVGRNYAGFRVLATKGRRSRIAVFPQTLEAIFRSSPRHQCTPLSGNN